MVFLIKLHQQHENGNDISRIYQENDKMYFLKK